MGPIGRHNLDLADPEEAEEELILVDHGAPATSPKAKIATRQGFMSPAERAALAATVTESEDAGTHPNPSEDKVGSEEPPPKRKPPPRRLADEIDEVPVPEVEPRAHHEAKALTNFDSDSDEEDFLAQEKQRLSERLEDAKAGGRGDEQ